MIQLEIILLCPHPSVAMYTFFLLPQTFYLFSFRGQTPNILLPHGNRKYGEREFIRSPPPMMEKARQEVLKTKSKKLYNKLMAEESELEMKPKDVKSLQNLTYNEKKKAKLEQGIVSPTTLSDQFVVVANMVASPEENMCEMISLSKRCMIPNVTICSPQMIQLMKGCTSVRSSCPSPIVADRTFNMAVAFLTSVVFECRALVYQDGRKEHPTLIAAAFIHTRSRYEDFQPFFNHLYMMMKKEDKPGLIQCNGDILCDETHEDGNRIQCVGADSETALVQAMKDGLRYDYCKHFSKSKTVPETI